MSISGPSEMIAKARRGGPDVGFPGLIRVVALIGAVVGSLGSVGLMLWVGHRNPSRVLLLLFAVWVLSPFIGFLLASIVSQRWSVIARATLHCAMLLVTLGSLAFYGDAVWRPRPQPAFVFLVVPLGSWLFMTIVVAIAALVSARLTSRGAGHQ